MKYYFCQKCGYHTASFGTIGRCPNCHKNTNLVLVGTTDNPELKQQIQAYIDAFNKK